MRSRWPSKNEVRFGTGLMRTPERARTVWVPVQLQSPAPQDVAVDYRVLTDQVRYIPLQILADSLVEGTETIVLGLDESRTDPVVGSPRVVRVKIDPPR